MRSLTSFLLVLVAIAATFVAVPAAWAKYTVLDRAEFTELMEPLGRDRGVQDAMAQEIAQQVQRLLTEQGDPVPTSAPELVRTILASLAAAYAQAIGDVDRLTGRTTRTVHLVGGGAQNALLCQLTADATGLPVVAGPVEATAMGNLLVQARTHHLIAGDLEALRAVVARSFPPHTYQARARATSTRQ